MTSLDHGNIHLDSDVLPFSSRSSTGWIVFAISTSSRLPPPPPTHSNARVCTQMATLLYRSSRLINGATLKLSVSPPFRPNSYLYPRTTNKIVGRRLLTSTPKEPVKESIAQEVKVSTESASGISGVWQRFTGPKEMPPRWTLPWYGEMVLICTVFAITGTSTMILVSFSTRLVLFLYFVANEENHFSRSSDSRFDQLLVMDLGCKEA